MTEKYELLFTTKQTLVYFSFGSNQRRGEL